MAVQDKYTDSNISGNAVTKLLKSINAQGAQIGALLATFEVAAADDNGSKYRIFKSLDPNIIPLAILVGTDGITGGTAYDIGLYKPDLGVAIAVDCFAANLDVSGAADLGFATALDGMDAVDIANYGRRLFEHAGHDVTNKLDGYDMVITADTVGTAAGTITALVIYAQG